MGVFEDIGHSFSAVGHELGVFVTQTIPGVATSIWNDTTGLVRDVIHIPQNLTQTAAPVLSGLTNKVTETVQSTISTLGTTISNVGNNAEKITGNVFNSPLIWVAGGVAILFLLKK